MVKADDQAVAGREDPTTRRKILDAAAVLIAEVGWSEVTTRRIAERAGVNNALIHYYFGTKDALLLAAATTAVTEELEDPMIKALGAPTLAGGLQAYIEYLRTIEEHGLGVIVSVEALLRGLRDDQVRGWIETTLAAARRHLEELVIAAQRRGDLPADLDPVGTAVVLAALFDGLVLYRLTDPDIDLEAVESSLLRLIGSKGNR